MGVSVLQLAPDKCPPRAPHTLLCLAPLATDSLFSLSRIRLSFFARQLRGRISRLRRKKINELEKEAKKFAAVIKGC